MGWRRGARHVPARIAWSRARARPAAAWLHRRRDAHIPAFGRVVGSGRLLSVRGRRQAGKSRLVSELVARAKLAAFFYTASRQATLEGDLTTFVADAAERSTLPGRQAFRGASAASWEAALRLVINALPAGPAIVVLDELPWLVQRDLGLEGTLQKLWDTELERRPVLLILVGSDLAMMEALTSHGRPLFGRPKELVVAPFHAGDTARMLGIHDAARAFEAWLVTGGYPRLLLEWRRARGFERFLREQLADENSDLLVVGTRVLAAEFPAEIQARLVLSAIGAGERAFTGLQSAAGLHASALQRSLELLRTKGLVAADLPLSTLPSRERRYRIADPYLRFWLHFVEPSVADIARGRPDLALARFRTRWPAWRGRAIEPLLRDSLLRLSAGDERLGRAAAVGGYWTRTNDVAVDLVGADQAPVAGHVAFVGSVKWREKAPFGREDQDALLALRPRVPGAARARVIAVSRSGFAVPGLDVALTPKELLAAWA